MQLWPRAGPELGVLGVGPVLPTCLLSCTVSTRPTVRSSETPKAQGRVGRAWSGRPQLLCLPVSSTRTSGLVLLVSCRAGGRSASGSPSFPVLKSRLLKSGRRGVGAREAGAEGALPGTHHHPSFPAVQKQGLFPRHGEVVRICSTLRRLAAFYR